jgi:hypothetical protein
MKGWSKEIPGPGRYWCQREVGGPVSIVTIEPWANVASGYWWHPIELPPPLTQDIVDALEGLPVIKKEK